MNLDTPTAQSAAPLVLGHTYPASGVFAEPAAAMKAALDAAVLHTNAAGGIGGRTLRLVSLDDGYDPQRSLNNAEALVKEHGAIALIAPLGVPSIGALMPWAESHRIPLIGARSGADSQRVYHRYTFFNVATFGDEVRHIARHLDTIGVRRVAVAAMDNPTGQDIAQQFQEATSYHRIEVIYSQRFDLAGAKAAEVSTKLTATRPAAVVLAGGGQGAVRMVQELLRAGQPASSIYSMSIIGTELLLRTVGDQGNGMVVTQVMPSLRDPRYPIAQHYQEQLMRLPGAVASPTGLEAFISMAIAIRAIRQVRPATSGSSLTAALERLGSTDIGGFPLRYDSRSHHGTRYVDMGIVLGGRLVR